MRVSQHKRVNNYTAVSPATCELIPHSEITENVHHYRQLQDFTMGKCCPLLESMTKDVNDTLQFVTLLLPSPPTPKNVCQTVPK